MNVMHYKTGKGTLGRLRKIKACPVDLRRSRFGRGWIWELHNGQQRIRDEFPELVSEMEAIFSQPMTIDDLTPIGHSFGV